MWVGVGGEVNQNEPQRDFLEGIWETPGAAPTRSAGGPEQR